jgi:hypothetical protein
MNIAFKNIHSDLSILEKLEAGKWTLDSVCRIPESVQLTGDYQYSLIARTHDIQTKSRTFRVGILCTTTNGVQLPVTLVIILVDKKDEGHAADLIPLLHSHVLYTCFVRCLFMERGFFL